MFASISELLLRWLDGIILQKSAAPAVSRCETKLLHVAVLSSELCCRTSSGASQSLRGGQHH